MVSDLFILQHAYAFGIRELPSPVHTHSKNAVLLASPATYPAAIAVSAALLGVQKPIGYVLQPFPD